MNKQELLQNGFRMTALKSVRPAGLYLVGEFSFGDADGEKTTEMNIESLEELEAIQKYLAWKDTMGWNEEIDYRRSHYQKMEDDFYAQAGKKFKEEYLWDDVLDWWASDPIAGCILARLEGTSLIYSDGEHEWSIEK